MTLAATPMVLVLAAAAGLATAQRDGTRTSPVVVDASDGILAAFGSHSIVALPDAHGSQQMHAFLLSVIRDPRFVQTVDDIVVEFGNARYQDVVDRFVRGEEVPYESLRRAWRDHTQPSLSADFTLHEDFVRAVRAVNAAAGLGRKLRLLLGDPPIDWDVTRAREEHLKWIEMRDAYPAAVLQIEVIAKNRRALLVYGVGHLQRRNVLSNFDMDDWRAQTITSLIERSGPTRVFTVVSVSRTLIPPDAAWAVPSVARIRGTTLGAVDASEYFGPRGRFAVRDGTIVPIPQDQWRTLPAEEQFDAVLYLEEPPATTSEPLSPALCKEPGYVEMRLKRIALAGLPPVEAERVKKLCGDKH